MWQVSRRFKALGETVQRARVDSLLQAAFGPGTWLLAAAGGFATVFVAGSGRTDGMATELLLTGLAGATFTAVSAAALTIICTIVAEMYRRRRRDGPLFDAVHAGQAAAEAAALTETAGEKIAHKEMLVDQEVPEQIGNEPIAAKQSMPEQIVADHVEAVRRLPAKSAASSAEPSRKIYLAADLQRRMQALAELAAQLHGPVQEACDFGHEVIRQIADASRTSTRHDIIDKLGRFKSASEASLKELAAIVRKYPFFREIKELGPWEYSNVVDKTELLLVLLSIIPNQALIERNFGNPALQRAGAEWMSAVDGFHRWLEDGKQKLADQQLEYESRRVVAHVQ